VKKILISGEDKYMATVEWLDNIWKNQRLANYLSYLIVAAMLSCFAIAIQQLGESYFRDWNGNYLPWSVFFVSLVAIYGRNLLNKQRTSIYEREYWTFRAAEWIIIAIAFRVFLYIYRGPLIFMQDLQAWKANWYTFFNDPEYFTSLVFLLIIWSISNTFGQDIDLLQSRPSDNMWERLSELEADRKAARQGLFSRCLSIGMVLVFITVVLRLNLGQIFGETASTQVATLNVLVYFGLAVILLSLSQFALLRGRWLWEQTPAQGNIARRWFIYASVFLALLVIVAILLPTAYSIGLLDTIRILVQIIAYAFSFLFFIIMSLVSLIFTGLLSLLGMVYQETPVQPEKPLIFDQLQQAAQNPGAVNPWLQVLAAIGFWVGLFVLVGLALWHYVHQNHELAGKLQAVPIFRWISDFWGWLLNALRGFGNEVKITFNEGVEKFRGRFTWSKAGSEWNYLSLRKLNAREKIIFYYLALVRRGEEEGLPRQKFQTPSQYSDLLKGELPLEAKPNLETLTENFLEARYSSHSFAEQDVNLVQRAWKEIRSALRRLRKTE
jgi:hypothetical protein